MFAHDVETLHTRSVLGGRVRGPGEGAFTVFYESVVRKHKTNVLLNILAYKHDVHLDCNGEFFGVVNDAMRLYFYFLFFRYSIH